MNKSIEILVMSLGGFSLFIVALLGFAAMSGAPMSKVPVVGKFFQADKHEPQEENTPVSEDPESPVYSESQVVEANVGMLSAYALQPPFTAEALGALASDLKAAKLAFEERLVVVDQREEELDVREELLTEQFLTLEEMRAELDRYEAKLSMQASEVERDLVAKDSEASAQWREVSRLFALGDAEEMTARLQQFGPDEAAQILANLDQERAAELLNALTEDVWKDYVDAYSKATIAQ